MSNLESFGSPLWRQVAWSGAAGWVQTVKLGMPGRPVILSVLALFYVASFLATDSDLLPAWLRRLIPVVLGLIMVAIAVDGLVDSRRRFSAKAP